MKKRVLIGFLLGAALTGSAAGPAPVVLPDVLRERLDKEYPGWKFARVSPQVQQEFVKQVVGHPPNLLAVDFDGDGSTDYIIQIALTEPGSEEQIIIAFMRRNQDYEENILESRGINPDVYLWSRKKRPSGAAETSAMKNYLIIMGSEAGDTAYLYADGKFQDAPPDDHP